MTGAMAGAMAKIMVMRHQALSRRAAEQIADDGAADDHAGAGGEALQAAQQPEVLDASGKQAAQQARENSQSERRMIRRRPGRQMAPCQSDITENISRYVVSVCCTSSGEACRESPVVERVNRCRPRMVRWPPVRPITG